MRILRHRRRGASITEYGLLIGLIGIVALLSIETTGQSIRGLFAGLGNQVNSVVNVAGGEDGTAGAGGGQQAVDNQGPFDGRILVHTKEINAHRLDRLNEDTLAQVTGGSWPFVAGDGSTYLTSVAADGAGNVYVGNGGGDALYKLNDQGVQQWQIDYTGGVKAVEIGPSGNVYTAVADKTLRKIAPDGTEIWSQAIPGNPEALAVDGDGNAYVGDRSDVVTQFEDQGASATQGWQYAGQGQSVIALAVDASGNVFSGDGSGAIHKIDAAGNGSGFFTIGDGVNALDVDGTGAVYAGSDNTRVHKIRPDGSTNEWRYFDPNNSVEDVVVAADGFVYAVDSDGGVHKIDDAGNQVTSVNLGNNHRAIAIAP